MGAKGIYGISGSGLDIESLVRAGMLSKQARYDKMYKKETAKAWEKEAYGEFYKSLTVFKFSTLSDYKMQSVMSARRAKSTDDSAVTATANGAAGLTTHRVTVNKLSSNAHIMTGTGKTITRATEDTNAQNSIKLADVVFQSIKKSGAQYKIKLNGQEQTVDANATALEFSISDGETERTIKYTYEELMQGKTLNDLAADINKKDGKDHNLQATFDLENNSFSIYNKKGGEENKIDINAKSSATYKLFNNMNLYKQSVDADGKIKLDDPVYFTANKNNQKIAGQNGEAVIDGKTYNKITDNKLTVEGVSYTFNSINKDKTPASISITQDTESIIGSVKKFVEDYNKMIDSMNSKIYEAKYPDYDPLTKEQEEKMGEKQAEKWTAKAKAGLLYKSPILRNIVGKMREALYTPVDGTTGKYNSAAALGVSSADDRGHLHLDEDKLKKALAADPDSVYKVFGQDDTTNINYDKDGNRIEGAKDAFAQKSSFRNTGIAWRLSNIAGDGLKAITNYAGVSGARHDSSQLGVKIKSISDRMRVFKTQMDDYQTRLYKKYDAMEQALARLSKQMGMFMGGN